MGSFLRVAVSTLTFLTLCVITVDEPGKIPVGRYDLRLSYLTFAAVGILFGWGLVKGFLKRQRGGSLEFELFVRTMKAPWFGFFLAMAYVGALATATNALNPSRSWLFLLWSAGTLLSVPLIMSWVTRLEPRVLSWLGTLNAVLLAVLVHDLLNCSMKLGLGYWGGMVAERGVCRPMAWYMEPNYLSGFFLFSYLVFHAGKKRLLQAVALAGAVFTTSRMGWIAVAGVLGLEVVFLALRGGRDRGKLAWAVVVPAMLLAIVAVRTPVFEYPVRTLSKIASDESMKERMLAGQAAMLGWKAHPWIGVAPGGSGAYYVEHWDGHPYKLYLQSHRRLDKSETYRNDPLSKDLLVEVLAEWGTVGALFFVLGLGAWFAPLVLREATLGARLHGGLLLGWVIFSVYATSQTLARFDLWALLGLAGALGQKRDFGGRVT
ncbi:MAG: O-antigen ligase family protein [Oligoflexia bacterium]|nr:O-antigen ligase family protein [Oligoflexia bacterium]